MNCKNCGANLKDGDLFCENCGTKAETVNKIFCGNCGAGMKSTDKFCPVCGAKTAGASAETPVKTAETSKKAEEPGVYCKRCGIELFKEDKVCPSCGKSVDEFDPEATVQMKSEDAHRFDVEETVQMGSEDAHRFYQMYNNTGNGNAHPQGAGAQPVPPSRRKPEKSGNKSVLIAVIISIVVLACAGGVIGWLLFGNDKTESADAEPTAASEVLEDDDEEPTERARRKDDDEEETERPRRYNDDEDEEDEEETERPSDDDSDEYLFESDKRYITESYLDGCTKEEVRLILNEMYARHGYIFKSEEYYNYFMQKSWYHPRYDNQEEAQRLFNKYEEENRLAIIDYEESMGWR